MSRYDGLIIPRSYSEYINKTDAATLQQALQLSGVLSGAVAADDNKAVTSNAVNGALANLREKRLGEIFNSNEYWKVGMIGFYARPIIIKCIGTLGLYDIAMFGQECAAKLIRLGGSSTQVTYKYTKPPENNRMGYLFIKSNAVNTACTIFTVDIYINNIKKTLEKSSKEEYDNATSFEL
uniref:Uncharacterized protein n=1 Tax=Siphoviridae sp. ctzm5103 TaxID=2825750 RepID=A0A8S5TT83_9CAUD|nr:MAG TPA: hypothetical protein [Siphoviridae sp. ctzm5103]